MQHGCRTAWRRGVRTSEKTQGRPKTGVSGGGEEHTCRRGRSVGLFMCTVQSQRGALAG
jgi:hypothetical protein